MVLTIQFQMLRSVHTNMQDPLSIYRDAAHGGLDGGNTVNDRCHATGPIFRCN